MAANARLQPNTTQIPNIILDEWMEELTGAELKVLLVIARQTYGWHKDFDSISYSQLIEKTGMGNGSVGRAVKSLKEKGLIETDGSGPGVILAYQIKITSPKMGNNLSQNGTPKMGDTKETNTKETLTKEEKEIDKEKERSVAVATSSPLKTLIRYSLLEDLTQADFEEIAEHYHVPLSFVASKYEDMCLWAGERPGNSRVKGRNWRLTLMHWVKRDAFEIHERRKGDPTKRAVDATNL